MQIIGCGVDIVEIRRIEKALTRHRFRERIFTAEEQQLLAKKSAQSWAGRFAAKEAVMKALGSGWQLGVGFRDIEINRDGLGKPVVNVSGRAAEYMQERGITDFFVSISHSKEYAVANVIAVAEKRCADEGGYS